MYQTLEGDIKMLSDSEFKMLAGFKNGKVVEEEKANEQAMVNEYASIGLMRKGFTFTSSGVRETAVLSPSGMNLYRRERMMRNPVRKFIYSMANAY